MKPRYWFAEVTYDGKTPFYFSWGAMVAVIADTELEASPQLQAQIEREWARISPHPAPLLMSVLPGRLVIEREEGRPV